MIKSFIFYWLTGQSERGEGVSPAHALTMLGYGAGAIRALDFYEESAKPTYHWDPNKKSWFVPIT